MLATVTAWPATGRQAIEEATDLFHAGPLGTEPGPTMDDAAVTGRKHLWGNWG